MKMLVEQLDWEKISRQLNDDGYAVIGEAITDQQCRALSEAYEKEELYRKTINMERYQFGLGEYKYFKYPLPNIIEQIRQCVYPYLAPIANNWMRVLNIDRKFPSNHEDLIAQCQLHHQMKPTPLILKYNAGGYNTLHQDLYGEIFFPMQLVLFLDNPDNDYKGGEFVLIEQRPRHNQKPLY